MAAERVTIRLLDGVKAAGTIEYDIDYRAGSAIRSLTYANDEIRAELLIALRDNPAPRVANRFGQVPDRALWLWPECVAQVLNRFKKRYPRFDYEPWEIPEPPPLPQGVIA